MYSNNHVQVQPPSWNTKIKNGKDVENQEVKVQVKYERHDLEAEADRDSDVYKRGVKDRDNLIFRI